MTREQQRAKWDKETFEQQAQEIKKLFPPKYKPIRMRAEKWQEVKDLAELLAKSRGSRVTLPDAISEAVKFYRDTRGTPDGPGTGESSHE